MQTDRQTQNDERNQKWVENEMIIVLLHIYMVMIMSLLRLITMSNVCMG
jgi:hypothetical protein